MIVEKINNNGFDFVDLELPSGTLWATKNIGAYNPTDFGLYFQWGDTKGYSSNQVGESKGKKYLGWDSYKWDINNGKYTTKGAKLGLNDDAAHVHMGGSWHIPTTEQIQELIDNTTSNWIKLDGANGRLFTSNKNGKSIFIPAAGLAWDGSVFGRGSNGYVWSSMMSSSNVHSSQFLGFNSDFAYLGNSSRYDGFSVRGVIG